jgi:glycosyltransferase involved in cell wall biosynthesis
MIQDRSATVECPVKAADPLRVLHVNAGNLYGGIETLLVTLARQRSCCPDMEPAFALCFEGRLSGELRQAGVSVCLLGEARLSRPWTVARARQRLRGLLDAEHCDVVISHGCWPHLIAGPVARRAGRPLVFWAHSAHAGRDGLEWWASRTAPDLVVANSQETQRLVRAHLFPRARMEILHYPVNRPAGSGPADARCVMRAALGTPNDAVVIVTACRLEPYKGNALLLESLGQLGKVDGWQCWIAGGAQRPQETDFMAHLQQQAAALGIANRVHFLGQRDDVPALLAAADIHCQPNLEPEPFGIVFVEALYAGLPVVTTAQGGALEIVDDSCGVLVAPGDARKLAVALGRLIGDGQARARLGAGGPARAAALCDPAGQMARMARLLRGMVRASA